LPARIDSARPAKKTTSGFDRTCILSETVPITEISGAIFARLDDGLSGGRADNILIHCANNPGRTPSCPAKQQESVTNHQ